MTNESSQGYGQYRVPIIADIKKFSLDDGPGIRTTVFFKGCAMRCDWCHNPELQSPDPQILFYHKQCIGCGACEAACRDSGSDRENTDKNLCIGCGRCAQVCPTGALKKMNMFLDPRELASLLLDDVLFYEASGGGVTLSGGEPVLFSHYCAQVTRKLRDRSVDVAIQTAGCFRWEDFENSFLPLINHIYFDLKTLDASQHKVLTGVDSVRIFDNFRRIAKSGVSMTATMVLVPGINDYVERIEEMRNFVASCGVDHFETRPFNAQGREKRWQVVTTPLCMLDEHVGKGILHS